MANRTGKPISTRNAATLAPPAPAAPPQDQSRDFLAISLCVRAETADDATLSVECDLATDGPVTVMDPENWRIIEERLISTGFDSPGQIPLLDSHNRWSVGSVLGSIRNLRIEGNKVVGRMFFARGDAAAESAYRKVKDKHITDVSVGYRAVSYVDIPAGQSHDVDGTKYTASADRTLRITTKWRAHEGSLTAIGADPNAKVRTKQGASPLPTQEPRKMNEQLRRYLESIGLQRDATDAQAWEFLGRVENEQQRAQINSLRFPTAAPASQPAPAAPVVAAAPAAAPQMTAAERAQADQTAATRERERIAAITGLRSQAITDEVFNRALNGDPQNNVPPMTIEQAGLAFLQAERSAMQLPVLAGSGRPNVPGVIVSRDASQQDEVRGMFAGFMLRMNQGEMLIDRNAPQARRQEQERVADLGENYRRMSLPDICRTCLELEGVHTRRMSTEDIVRAAISTASLSMVFSTSMNRMVLATFEEAPDSTDGWVSEVDVANYKQNDRFLPLKNITPAKKRRARGAAAEQITFNELAESYKAYEYAEALEVDEQDLLDDDMSIFQTRPVEMALDMARIKPDLVYSILLANAALTTTGGALFNSTAVTTAGGHANLATGGAGTALSATSLQTAVQAIGKQTESGVNLNLSPTHLIVPQDLRFTAAQLISSALLIDGTATGTQGNRNTIADLNLNLRIDNRIGVAGVTDPVTGTAYPGTATNWFLFAGNRRTIEVGYVAGFNRRPRLTPYRLAEPKFGLGWAMQFAVGAKALDYRPMYKSPGA